MQLLSDIDEGRNGDYFMNLPTWKNTLTDEHRVWTELLDFMLAVQSVGYKFGVWTEPDGKKVYTFTLNKFGALVVEPTNFTIDDVV